MSTFGTQLTSDPRDPQVRTVQTRLGPVEVATSGTGPALLALHGAMGGWDQGILLARSLDARDLRWVAPSRPGYLGTPLSVGRTPEAQADAHAALLDALRIDAAVVAAVSGGGPSAIQLALRHPDRCRALVLVSANAVGRIDVRLPLAWHLMKVAARVPPLVAAMRRKAERDPEASARRSIPDAALRGRTLRDPEAGPLMLALQASTLDRMGLRLAGTEADIATSRAELRPALERISAPVLVVHGTGDRAAPFAQAEAVAARVPGAELLAIAGGEHVALFTHLAEVRARVAAFLRDHALAAPRDDSPVPQAEPGAGPTGVDVR
jgi:pimeloyl-ACP methyl ester carboxylesterase